MTFRPLGIWPMLYAFFDHSGALDRTLMRRQVEACVREGAHGVAVLGLATEVNKLTDAERHTLVTWLAEDLDGRRPFAVTVTGETPEDQLAFARFAAEAGASMVILQPPRGEPIDELALSRFFGAVADGAPLPVGIQNAPDYLGVGLSPPAIKALHRNHANFVMLKGESPVTTIQRIIEETEGGIAVFNGRGGLELPDNMRAGCDGMIPAPDFFDRQVRIFGLMRTLDDGENEAIAESLYREILPGIVFVMQSIDMLVCYGKRIAAWRLGMRDAVHDRTPALAPTEFGVECAHRFASALGPFEEL
ncbi:MAG: dihydrodipicolinate synthase family protein [Alphaproteobacteria bacterium]|nr:dihydrodipicolinate synthase family protein [Alphaproteobacteria bacterium]